jgi:hypothetical protein
MKESRVTGTARDITKMTCDCQLEAQAKAVKENKGQTDREKRMGGKTHLLSPFLLPNCDIGNKGPTQSCTLSDPDKPTLENGVKTHEPARVLARVVSHKRRRGGA